MHSRFVRILRTLIKRQRTLLTLEPKSRTLRLVRARKFDTFTFCFTY